MTVDKRLQEQEEERRRFQEAGREELEAEGDQDEIRRRDTEAAIDRIADAASEKFERVTLHVDSEGEPLEVAHEDEIVGGTIRRPSDLANGEEPVDPDRDYLDKNTPA